MTQLCAMFRAAMLIAVAAGSAPAFAGSHGTGGTIEGTTTTQGNALLNGMCGKLYDAQGNNELIDFAGTGTDGTMGHYTQANVPAGRYVLLFVNCGANTDGVSPDYYYTPIFFGSTWNVHQATKVVVQNGVTLTLGPQQIPLGGYVTGKVTDTTTNAPADTPPVLFVPPGGDSFFTRFSWTLVCANPDGTYSSNTYFQQGVPPGAKVVFAPNGWGCSDSHGVFNAGEWVPKSKAISVSPGGTVKVNGKIAEAGG